MTKYRPATPKERAVDIALGLFVSLIFAAGFSFIAPVLFSLIAGVFNPEPELIFECNIRDFPDKTLSEYKACKDQSVHYYVQVERLSAKIPWFCIGFFPLAWMFLKNPLKGRIRDGSEDIIYPAEGLWALVRDTLFYIVFFIAIWAFAARDIPAFIALGLGLLSRYLWGLADKYFRKRFGRRRGGVET